MNRTVVLVGAGHAHLHVVSNARAFTTRGVRLVLVDPGIFWYSGMATGMLSGQYEPADDQIDVADLALRFGAEFIPGKVSSISREHKRVVLESGQDLTYDLLSLNVGSRVPPLDLPNDGTVRTFQVKPISQMADLRQELMGTGVLVSEINPGRVTTEFYEVALDDLESRSRAQNTGITELSPDDVAASIIHVLDAPRHVSINQLEIVPAEQTYGGYQFTPFED